jgi:Spy/CpxP family protein refolding chaperone
MAAALSVGASAQSQNGTEANSSAQTQASPQAGHQRWHRRDKARIAQQLNLTDQQKQQLQSMRQAQRQQIAAVKQDSSLTDQQKQEKIQQIREQGRTQFESVLTPDQKTKLQQMHNRGPMSQLNLTEQQRSQIRPILQQSRQQMQSLRQDTNLTSEQKKEKVKQIREQTHSQIMSLLTPEQQQKWQQMQQEHRRGRKGDAAPQGI